MALSASRPAIGRTLVVLINQSVEAGLVTFVIDDQRRDILEVDLAEHSMRFCRCW